MQTDGINTNGSPLVGMDVDEIACFHVLCQYNSQWFYDLWFLQLWPLLFFPECLYRLIVINCLIDNAILCTRNFKDIQGSPILGKVSLILHNLPFVFHQPSNSSNNNAATRKISKISINSERFLYPFHLHRLFVNYQSSRATEWPKCVNCSEVHHS